MKLLLISSGNFFSTYGGGQVYVKNLVDAFIDFKNNDNNNSPSHYGEGWGEAIDLSVISFVNEIPEPQLKKYRGIELWEIPENSEEKTFQEVIEKISPDLIHAHSHKALACRIGKRKGIPVIITSHHGGLWCPGGAAMDCKDQICSRKVNHKVCLPCVLRNTRTGLKFWYPFMKYLPEKNYIKLGENLKNKLFIPFITPIGSAALQIKNKKKEWQEICNKCALMIVPSNKMAEIMITNGMSEEKIKIIPHGIPLPKEIPPFPKIKEGKIKFFYVGRICYVKGIHILLEAFSQVKNPEIELHLIGGTGNKEEVRYMRKLQTKFEKDKRIIWHGKVSPDEIYEKIKNYHISISPSICLEAFGLNITEALALGKPVLTTENGGGEMQIDNFLKGWIIPQNNINYFVKIFNDIIHTDLSSYKSIKINYKQSINHNAKLLINLYKNYLNL